MRDNPQGPSATETHAATKPGPNAGNTGAPHSQQSEQAAPSLVPVEGWHFLHLFYRVDRGRLGEFSHSQRERGLEELRRTMSGTAPGGPEQLQCFAVPGHKADFGIMMAGPNLRGIHDLQMAIQASSLGPALEPTYSFYSITEVSEYALSAERYAEILRDREGIDPDSNIYKSKIAAYAERREAMNRQRQYPEFPAWPCVCFYPMSKTRVPEHNWYMLPFEARSELMGAHGRIGMKYGGRVSQLISASTGLDNWEWGVTLWATNPVHLKDIVYTMRFDEASARYALFGDFYFGYILPPDELLEAIRL